jgi:hypothetical protein
VLIHTIHVVPTGKLAEISPTRRLLVSQWLLALKDRATSICFTYGPGLSTLKYEVDGQWLDLEPPPGSFGPLLGREVRSWINPSFFRRTLADQFRRLATRFDRDSLKTLHYPFMLIIDPIWSIWGFTIRESRDGGTLTFDLLDCTDWAYDQVELIRESMPDLGEIGEEEFAKWYPGL